MSISTVLVLHFQTLALSMNHSGAVDSSYLDPLFQPLQFVPLQMLCAPYGTWFTPNLIHFLNFCWGHSNQVYP